MSDLEFNFEDLHFIQLIGDGNKNPAKAWGGYSQDFDDAEHIHRHDDVAMYPDDREWGVVGIEDVDHGSTSLLIFDLDVHKAGADFEPEDLQLPSNTAIVRSQNGGFHVYFMVHEPRGGGSESDFTMTRDLEWDIDIRGSYVSHHVVAPNAIPGVGGEYELVNDDSIAGVFDPAEAAERIVYQDEPLLEYDRDTGIGDFEFDRPSDAPDEMPTSYHAGLELRKAAPDDHPNTHKVNVLTALTGLAAGYSVDEVVDHFVNEYAPVDGGVNVCDVDKTRYQVKHLAQNLDRGRYSPPAVSTLREWGILEEGETCEVVAGFHDHGRAELDVLRDDNDDRDVAAEAAAVAGPDPDAADKETHAETDGGAAATSASSSSGHGFEDEVVEAIRNAEDEVIEHKTARHRIARAFDRYHSFVYPEEEVRGWRSTLYVYNEDEGVYEPRGENFVESTLERVAGDYVTNTVSNEVIGKLERMSIARGDRFRVDPHRLVAANGILDLHTGDLDPWTPAEYHRTKLDVAWNPDVGDPEIIDDFFHDIVESQNVDTLYRLIAHALYKEYAAEKAAMLVGGGQNGKSVFLSFVERFLGDWNVSHRALQEFSDNDFAANALEGKLANIHPDMGDEGVTDMSTFKKLTGRDTMMANVKYEAPITFENYATMMFAANEMPVFSEDNHAVWRRWVYINFPYTFDETNPEAKEPTPKRVLMRRLTQDDQLEALLVRCQQEIAEWYDGREWFPDAMRPDQVRKQMKKAAEPVFNFATTCLQPVDDDDTWIEKDLVRQAYREYATQEGLPKLGQEQFGERLLNLSDYSIETARPRADNGTRPTVYKRIQWTKRGRQVLGLDEPEHEDQTTVGDVDSTKKDVLQIVKDLVNEADNEPVAEEMVVGRAMSEMTMSTARNALENLKAQGDVYEPPSHPGKVIDT